VGTYSHNWLQEVITLQELTPADSERVNQIRIALEQELREAPSASRTAVKDIEDLKEDALASLRTIIKHSANESLKAKVSMWTYDTILNTAKTLADEPIVEFLKEMDASRK